MHQEVITAAGLVEDFYDYGTYRYEERVVKAMLEAKNQKIGLYASAAEHKSESNSPKINLKLKGKNNQTSQSFSETEKEDNEKHTSKGAWLPIILGALLVIGILFYLKVKFSLLL
ncbi:hypothetical protein ACFSO7_08045 [Bacillus sp. CGMCC 1.16607]|uniref:hypothetical protein n=1 Tax=Bacillus sp. CGMCC 1.16607 TaxID=3351842 RepID=UPI0036439C72